MQFLSMHDNWRATHNDTWLAAAKGAYDTVLANFLNVDGTAALREGRPDGGTDWHPKSYPLRSGARTGETCCSIFWVKFCQRFQLISPWEERHSAEIEKTLCELTAPASAILTRFRYLPTCGALAAVRSSIH